MDEIARLAAIVATLVTSSPDSTALSASVAPVAPPAVRSWTMAAPGEDKFRHAAMSWAVTAFAYAGARAAGQDGNVALVIALPITAAVGVGKEIADHRRGGRFSVRDLVADAVGAAAAWAVLREVH